METNNISRRGRCKYCGKLVHVGDNRCPNCGKPLSWGPAALPTTNSPSGNDGENPSEQQTASDVTTSSPNTQSNSIGQSTEPISGGEHKTTTNRIGRCKYCGKIVHIGDNRCSNCGHELSWTKKAADSSKPFAPKYRPPTKTEDSDRVKYYRNLHIGSWVLGSLFFIGLTAIACQAMKVVDEMGDEAMDYAYQTHEFDKHYQAYLREKDKPGYEYYNSINNEYFKPNPREQSKNPLIEWKAESTCVFISDTIALYLQSVPNHLWFGKYEVTQAQWEAVMGNNPSWFKNPDNPVENVSWKECQKFLEKLNEMPSVKNAGLTFRLPTEEEWELACRAGATGNYCCLEDGTEITASTLDQVAWFNENSDKQTHPVGQKKPNAFGLYDMHGNVRELNTTATGDVGVHRGGSWGGSTEICAASKRLWSSPSYRSYGIGFRLCADIKDK